MLASDEEGGALDALRFSLASDIVELVVLTSDEAFLQTLREAVGGARRLWHVPSGDKVSDLLVAGQVGILVLDVQSLVEAATVFIAQIKRQFPDLVVVVAGTRDAETSLAGLISDGIVYRFIHKPMSPGRARLFADAAVKKFEEQRRRSGATPSAARKPRSKRAALIGGAAGVLGAIVFATWMLQKNSDNGAAPPHASGAAHPPAGESALLASAAAALAANRLTEPAGDNALELYLQAQARDPADPRTRAGLAEVHERLLARAENALLEERLDEAAAAIETARRSGVEIGRITFMNAQLAKSRDQLKAAQAAARARAPPKSDASATSALLNLAGQRLSEARLIEPERDSALFYIREALRLDPDNDAVGEAQKTLAMRLLTEAHGAIERRDFVHASGWLEAAQGIAAPANIEAAEASLAAARRQADADASAAMQDLGSRLVAKGRRALALEQYDAARSALDEAQAAGLVSAELTTLRHDLDSAVRKLDFMTNVVAAGDLKLIKSIQPEYPKKANLNKIQGWVELDFTVTENGDVRDIDVHAASLPGVFDSAAIHALSQWRYQPVMRDSKAVPQRARLRIRFALAD